jgi:G:T-mismatch repair DNA endonuclease (very short patch repair protein)
VARPEGLEPPAYWFEANRSIQLSYGRDDSVSMVPLARRAYTNIFCHQCFFHKSSKCNLFTVTKGHAM